MQFISSFEQGRDKIIRRYPEFAASVFEADDSGWTNFAIKADDRVLFRFPRKEEAYESIQNEVKILDILNRKLPDTIRVPKYIYSDLEGDCPFVGYELIQGEFLTKDLYGSLPEKKKETVCALLAEFLNILHSVDYRELDLTPESSVDGYREFYQEIQEICFPNFDENLKNRTTALFEGYFDDPSMHRFTPCLIHGDLSEDHIIVTDGGVGIIDFGDVMAFDPAYDLIWAYLCGKDCYDRVTDGYRGRKDDWMEHRIRDFHVIRIPYSGVIYADEIEDPDMLREQLQELNHNFLEHDRLAERPI